MNDVNQARCPQCGAPLPARAPEGLCPRCLGALNLGPDTVLTGEEPAATLPLLSPAELAPHFPQLEILECLGRGGMGVVYRARQKTLDRMVALKLLAPGREQDPTFAERFAREAQALARLSHPSIVTVHDFGRAGDFYFLLMEFVDGVNLRQLLRSRKLTPEEALAIVPPLCDALQYAHERGIVHRDIKPENLLLDKTGRVKIADFGIAKMLGTNGGESTSADAAVHSTAAGTPQYMAPEQKSAPQQVDSRADIYSLGVVFYEMLTGELPDAKLQPPSRRVQVDVRLDEIVLRALEVKPEMRFATAAEFRAEIATLTKTPVVPSQPFQPGNRRWERHWHTLSPLKRLMIRRCLYVFALLFTLNFVAPHLSVLGDGSTRVWTAGLFPHPWLAEMERTTSGGNHQAKLHVFFTRFTFISGFLAAAAWIALGGVLKAENGPGLLRLRGEPDAHGQRPVLVDRVVLAGLALLSITSLASTACLALFAAFTGDAPPLLPSLIFNLCPTLWVLALAIFKGDSARPQANPRLGKRAAWIMVFALACIAVGLIAASIHFMRVERQKLTPPRPVVVEVPQTRLVTTADAAAPSSNFSPSGSNSFAQIQSATLPYGSTLDFSSGAIGQMPGSLRAVADVRVPEDQIYNWMKGTNADVAYPGDGNFYGMMLNMVTFKRAEWDNCTADQLAAALHGESSDLRVRFDQNDPDKYTFGFKNGEGRLGLLQVTGLTKNPRGVQVRYKLVEASRSSVIQPTTVATTSLTSPVPVSDNTNLFAGAPELRFLRWWQPNTESTYLASWHADGSIVTNHADFALLQRLEIPGYQPWNTNLATLQLAFSHPAIDRVSVLQVTLRDSNGVVLPLLEGMASNCRSPAKEIGGLGWAVISLCPGKKGQVPATVDIEFRVDGGFWYNNDVIPVTYNGSKTLAGGSLLGAIGENIKGAAFISVVRKTQLDDKYQLDVLAYSTAGLPVERSGKSVTGQGEVQSERFEFNLPLSKIRSFQTRTRSFATWVYRNISLIPGRITKISVINPVYEATKQGALQTVSYQEFDQSPGKYWRELADVRRFTEAARMIEQYLAAHPELEKGSQQVNGVNLHFHAAQCWAMAGVKDAALKHLTLARHNEKWEAASDLCWNDYVAGTEAFLRGDRAALTKAHEKLSHAPEENLPNLKVLDRLLANFNKSYAEAYEMDNQDHKKLSAECFNRTWELLEKKNRTPEENEQMISLAHASLAHWRQREDCQPRNLSIGYWQISRVYAVLGQAENAARYGDLSLDFSGAEPPFYSAYAHEALARAAKLKGDTAKLKLHLESARELAAKVTDAGERQQLLTDLDDLGR